MDISDSIGITNFDLKDKSLVEIFVGDDDKEKVDKTVEYLKENFPDIAEVDKNKIVVEDYDGDVRSIDSFTRWLNSHQLDKVINTGILLGDKIDTLRNEIDDNFKEMDNKYKFSDGMFAVVNELKETNKTLGERIEKTDKNIEELLKILVEKKRGNFF